jgi:hypothetical protein
MRQVSLAKVEAALLDVIVQIRALDLGDDPDLEAIRTSKLNALYDVVDAVRAECSDASERAGRIMSFDAAPATSS